MSTQIKKNGNWVTVAGGTRMWVGTKAALQAALDAGELVDGTTVMVTDDYEDVSYPRPDWANAVAISKEQMLAGYMAPADGMFVGYVFSTGPNEGIMITVNDITITRLHHIETGPNEQIKGIQCVCEKNNVIKASAALSNSDSAMHFVPWK